MRTLLLSFLVAVVGAASLQAQSSDERMTREQKNAAEKAAVKELLQLLHTFWTPKLNDYRRYIDRSLSDPDLTQLNTLRLRFAFFMEQAKQMRAAQRAEYVAQRARYEREATVADDDVIDAEYATIEEGPYPAEGMYDTASVEIAVDYPEDGNGTSYEIADESATVDIAVAMPEDETAIAAQPTDVSLEVADEFAPGSDVAMVREEGVETEEETYVVPEREDRKIFVETTSLAARYGTMSDMLRRKVSEDMVDFLDQVVTVFEKISKEYPGLANPREEKDFQEMRDLSKRRVVVEELLTATWQDVRPFIMLYNGEGLLPILMGMGVDEFEGVDLSAASVDGESAIVGRTVLMQNSPNPAATTTVISYRLAESSAATRLKVYSANGQAMADIDLGPLAKGDHETTIDVSSYAPGAYVYHLSAQSSMGEEVYSKMMQVVR